MADAIAVAAACSVSTGMELATACAVCAKCWASLNGWVAKLQASRKTSITIRDRIFEGRDI
jgi:hypothetical protein